MSAPDQNTMGSAMEDFGAGARNTSQAPLGGKSSDYAGCWYACGGIVMYGMIPCGEGCIYPCLCCCSVPVCMCYKKDAQDGQWKEACEDKGGKKIMHMADEKTIQMIPSAAGKDQPNFLNLPMTLKKLC